jgi:hypothetical protein
MRNSFGQLLITLFLVTLFTHSLTAQVVISSTSTTPVEDGSAVLELQSPDMGLLIPKFAIDDLTDQAPVTSTPAAVGLLVYNTSTITEPGFYFWDGSIWREVINDQRVFANEQFGELFEIDTLGTPTLIELNIADQYYGWKSAKEGIISAGMSADTANALADRMNITKYGLYKVAVSLSIGGTQNQQITTSVFIVRGGVDIETRIKVLTKISSQGDLNSGSSVGVLELFPGDAIDLRFKTNNNNEDIEIYSINYIATKVGE